MTTPNFRALCAELVDELNYHADEHSVDKLISRARTALATPLPEPPTDDEIADVWLTVASEDRTLSSFGRAVLDRWGR